MSGSLAVQLGAGAERFEARKNYAFWVGVVGVAIAALATTSLVLNHYKVVQAPDLALKGKVFAGIGGGIALAGIAGFFYYRRAAHALRALETLMEAEEQLQEPESPSSAAEAQKDAAATEDGTAAKPTPSAASAAIWAALMSDSATPAPV